TRNPEGRRERRRDRPARGGERHQAAADGGSEEGLQQPDRDGSQHVPATRIIVSGPLPTYRRGHERLFRADGLHPSRVGAELLSDNISRTLRSI
ncbi:hypothetical protein M9458_015365, partial [Cirrhinus mrigala]